MRPKQLIVAWRRWWSRFSPREHIRRGLFSRQCVKCSLKESGPLLSRFREKKERRRNSEEEQGQRKASQQMVSPAPGRYHGGTPASLGGFDLVRIGCTHGESGGAGFFGASNDRIRTLSNSPGRERLPMDEDGSL